MWRNIKYGMRFGLLSVFAMLVMNPVLCQTSKMTVADYISTYKDFAIQEMALYKIPASITLAQGILESDNGNSELALKTNNHFGIKCKPEWTGEKYYHDDDAKDECFRKYSSVFDSYRDHSLFLTTRDRYAFLFQLEMTDYTGWAIGLEAAGYATDPDYAEHLIRIITENQLSEFDHGHEPLVTDTIQDTTSKQDHVVAIDTMPKPVIIQNNAPDFQDVILSENSRRIGQINGVRYIQARKDDSYTSIAQDFGLTARDIATYNDLKKDHVPQTGEVVYIESKKDNGPVEFHTVAAGETMHGISQLYAIKLRSLYRKNLMKYGTEATPGQKLYLQKTAPVY